MVNQGDVNRELVLAPDELFGSIERIDENKSIGIDWRSACAILR